MTDNSLNLSQVIRKRLNDDGARYWAGDNISKYITDKEKDLLVDELTEKFEAIALNSRLPNTPFPDNPRLAVREVLPF